MKYFPKLNLYKLSNVVFNPATLEAHSYGHWKFFGKAPNGDFVFSDYRYSSSTSAHQRKVRRFLDEKYSFHTVHYLELPGGVEDAEGGIRFYEARIDRLERDMYRRGSRWRTNQRRRQQIAESRLSIETIRRIFFMNAAFPEKQAAFEKEMHDSLKKLAC